MGQHASIRRLVSDRRSHRLPPANRGTRCRRHILRMPVNRTTHRVHRRVNSGDASVTRARMDTVKRGLVRAHMVSEVHAYPLGKAALHRRSRVSLQQDHGPCRRGTWATPSRLSEAGYAGCRAAVLAGQERGARDAYCGPQFKVEHLRGWPYQRYRIDPSARGQDALTNHRRPAYSGCTR